jgi:hypothetical protein
LSEGARTAISLLLFIHLFALGLVFLSNFEGGEWDSELLANMKVPLRPYLYPLWLDRPYHNHLTYGKELDYDHYIDVELAPGDSSAEAATIRLPADELGRGIRRQRYERLAWHLARRAEFETGDDLLPLAVGAAVLRQNDAKRAQLRCLRKRPLFFDEVREGTSREAPDERVYAADVFFLPGFDQPQLNKIGEARDVAPVTRPPGSGGAGPNERRAKDDSKGPADQPTEPRSTLPPQNNPFRTPLIAPPSNNK